MAWNRLSVHETSPAGAGWRTEPSFCSMPMHAATCLFVAHSIYFVYYVQHAIAIYGIVLCVAAHGCVYGAAYIALLVQNIIQLECHCERIAFQEARCYLSVPQEFVGVERRVVKASTTAHGQISRYRKPLPWQFDIATGSIGEVPRVHIVLRLHFVVGVRIVHRAIQRNLEHIVAIAKFKAFVQICCLNRIAHAVAIDILAYVRHVVRIRNIGIGAVREFFITWQRRIEMETATQTPIAIYILGLRYASTG